MKKNFTDVVVFVKTAMKKGLEVNTIPFCHSISVKSEDIDICIVLDDLNNLGIGSINAEIDCGQLTEREKLAFEALELDIKEYNKEKLLDVFESIFTESEDLKTMDDLDDE